MPRKKRKTILQFAAVGAVLMLATTVWLFAKPKPNAPAPSSPPPRTASNPVAAPLPIEQPSVPPAPAAAPQAGTVSGTILSMENTPISALQIEFSVPQGATFQAQSNSDGTYCSPVLPPGDYMVSCTCPDKMVPAKNAESLYRLKVGDAPITGIDFRFARAGLSISGLVTDASGTPIIGAKVSYHTADIGPTYFRGCESNRDGSFFLEHIADSRDGYLIASAEGYARSDYIPVQIAGTSVEDVRISLARATSIKGRVIDQDGAPFAGVRVTLLSAGNEIGAFETDEEGAFTGENIAVGRYGVLVAPVGMAAASGDRFAYEVISPEGVELHDGLNTVEIRVQNEPLNSVSGIVVDRANAPIAGAKVSSPRPCIPTTTGADGRFQLVTPGDDDDRVVVYAEAAGYSQTIFREVHAGQSDAVLVLDKAVSVVIRVMDSTAGTAVTSYRLAMHRLEGNEFMNVPEMSFPGVLRDVQSPDGTCRVDNLALGKYRLSVEANAERHIEDLDITPASDGKEFVIQWGGDGVFEFTVTDALTRAPVPNVSITLIAAGHDPLAVALGGRTDLSGKLILTGVADGNYDLSTHHDEYSDYLDSVSMSQARRIPFTIQLSSGAHVSGVLRHNGVPESCPRVQIYILRDGALDFIKTASADAAGNFTFEGIPPGTYKLEAMVASEYPFVGREVTIAGNAPVIADIDY